MYVELFSALVLCIAIVVGVIINNAAENGEVLPTSILFR